MEAITIVKELVEYTRHGRNGELLNRAAKTIPFEELSRAGRGIMRWLWQLEDHLNYKTTRLENESISELLRICPEMSQLFILENGELILAKSLTKTEIDLISEFVQKNYRRGKFIGPDPDNKFTRFQNWFRKLFLK